MYASFSQPADQRAAELLAGDLAVLRKQAAADTAAVASARRRLARMRPDLDVVLPACTSIRDYRELADALRDAVRDNRLRPGEPFPSAASLAAHTGVARSTAQRTISLLGEEGLIDRVGGRWEVANGAQAEAV